MADRIGMDLINRARLPQGPGREEITWHRELRVIEQEFLKADGQKPKGRLSQAAVDALLALDANDLASEAARRNLARIQAEAPRLLWKPEAQQGVTAVRPGHVALPVFINANGWAVPSADVVGQPRDAKTILLGAYSLQEAIRRQVRISRSSLPTLLTMPAEVKAKMIETSISTANMARDVPVGGNLPGLTPAETMELRSSAFTNLLSLATTLERATHGRLIDRVHNFCVELAEKEPHRWLGEHMTKMLNHPTYKAKLTEAQKVDSMEAWEGRRRTSFDVKNIMDAQGYVRWEHVCGEGENFFESFKHTMQKPGVHGAKFKVVPGSERFGSYDLQLDFNPPRNVNGQEIKGVKMHVRRFDGDMFDAIGKNVGTPERPVYQGLSYGGHSNIGENQEMSLKKAIAEGRTAKSPQLALLDLCAGLDNLDAGMKNLGDVDLMTTHDSSYFNKGAVRDVNGNVVVNDGVTRSEGQDILIETLASLTAGESYKQLHARFERVIPEWQHPEAPNTHPPTFPNYQNVLYFHTDGDDDGVMDARDIHFHCSLVSIPEDKDREFTLKALPAGVRPDMVKGTAAMNAVLDLNVATHYNAVIHDEASVLHKFVADGFFDGEGQKDLVRFGFDEMYNGSKGITVQYNSGLAHTTREALEGLTMYQSVMMLADRGDKGLQPSVRGLSEVDRKLMGLTFAAFRLNYDGEGNWNDQRIWKQLLDVLRLPPNLPYAALTRLLDAEHHDYSGNLEIVRKYKQELQAIDPNLVRQLESRDVGRPVGDPPPVGPIA
ncbi:hypothetical protein L6R52_28990 [Myxococcota bacterium]|nr:hypothetical protein [Myxococcota bacterium]